MNELDVIIRDIIRRQGAISLSAYMELALQHPEHGYYRVKKPIGRDGDFVTAPEISQMFGEMIGVWCAETWRKMGKPHPFTLLELGPGNGTMMQDILRATKKVSGFSDAKSLFLIDSDKTLRTEQRKKLGHDVRYVETLDQLPAIPTIILANEFFDALPVRQFEKTFTGWAERMVVVENEKLSMALRSLDEAELNLIPSEIRDSSPNTVFELPAKSLHVMHDLLRHLATKTGVLLVVDYGYVVRSGAATVQAVSSHSYADIFDRPGEVDLTAHVDFSLLMRVATELGVPISPVQGQGEFLSNLGIDIRAESLKRGASLAQAAQIDVDLRRLTDPSAMGQLYKVLEINSY